ncbi:oligo-1,6-glucosidase [Anoxybacillus flavithermus TNO-09.006]|uniref:oligo-1,6-glucosidase n=1 Tax=Anoxybacillus flavithermus TaxID=33934 RepID=A0A178TD49_9BACL|nr:alpha-glucosidase [Anoxybacillus flavithermus]ELK21172.1 oligo-1,6-glucosidase [Anoxybacillus flavithermus TNO-09.006]OAO79207.1 Oligo-16-glucosidase [Anoxybacillus flavithermus]
MESIPKTKQWWKEAVVYQIYPRSFKDSNGDGIGDLRGIIEKLDYLQELGVDVVWLSPVYKSPNDDNGYDISDYQDIMDEFGTLADWDELLHEMHARGMKLVMDLVVNHTSDEHHWFIESRKSKDNPYRDYYIWRPGKDGKEPNNWQSFFSGSAWQYDEATGEYYLHLFSKKQPDLNWENEKVREEIFNMMTWWLDRGIDGFRMDVINLLSKVEGLPDAPVTNPNDRYQWGGQYFVNGPKLMDYLREMKEKVLSKYDIMTVGETPMVTTDDAIRFTNEQDGVMNMLFQFEHMDVDSKPGSPLGKWDIQPWKLTDLKKIMSKWQVELHGKGWNSLYLENHDQPRSVSRFGDDKTYHVESAKMLATWLHMMQGTPYIYQGQEIGMTNVSFPSIEYYRDVETINLWNDVVVNKGYDPDKILKAIHYRGRDNARTPMQWDATEHAGFTTGTPWINVNPNYRDINVEQALKDENSVFHYYKKLIRLRKEHPIIVYGSYELLLEDDEQIYAYVRKFNDEQLLVITNFSSEQPTFTLPSHITFTEKQLLISNYTVDENESIDTIVLKPYEARVYKLK